MVGFDLEWKPEFKSGADHPIAVMQLAVRDQVLLLHTRGVWTPKLTRLLHDWLLSPSLFFAGVGLHSDRDKLRTLFGEDFMERFRLHDLRAHHFLRNANAKHFGFDRFVQAFEKTEERLVVRPSKNFKEKMHTTCSNWEKPKLSNLQLAYAAFDAWGASQLWIGISRLCGCEECDWLHAQPFHLRPLAESDLQRCDICQYLALTNTQEFEAHLLTHQPSMYDNECQ